MLNTGTPDRQRARRLVDRRLGPERDPVGRRRRLGQPVDVVDVDAGGVQEAVRRRGGDGRAAGVDRSERREVVLLEAGGRHQRGEHGDGADRERRPVLLQRVEDDVGVEPVGQDQRHRHQQADRDVPDQAGDVEQRRDAEEPVVLAQPDPVAVDLRVEHDVPVGVPRALRRAGRAGGVGQERGVVEAQRHRRRGRAAVTVHQLDEVLRALAADPLDPPQSRSSLRLWKSSGDVVITRSTDVRGTT